MDDATIAAMSPEEATAALAAMAAAPPTLPPDATTAAAALPPSTARNAQARLNTLAKDPGWSAKLLAGHADARREFFELSAAAAAADAMSDALTEPSGVIETIVNEGMPRRHVASFIADMREAGISDGAIAEGVNGVPVTKENYERAKAYQRACQADPAWRDRLLKGGYAEKREQLLMSIILSSPIRG